MSKIDSLQPRDLCLDHVWRHAISAGSYMRQTTRITTDRCFVFAQKQMQSSCGKTGIGHFNACDSVFATGLDRGSDRRTHCNGHFSGVRRKNLEAENIRKKVWVRELLL